MASPAQKPFVRSYDQLVESEARHRTLVENPDFGVLLLDRKGNYLYVNSRIQELTGYPPEEFYRSRRMGFRITHPDDHAVGVRAFRRALMGKASQHQEFRLRHRNGDCRWTSAASFPVFDDGGAVHLIQVVIQDLTDRKRAEEALVREYEICDAEAAVRVRVAQMEAHTDLLGVVDEISRQLARLGLAHDSCSIQIVNADGTDFVSCGSRDSGTTRQRLETLRNLTWAPASDNMRRYPWVGQVWRTGESRYVPATDPASNLPAGMSLVDVAFSHGTLAVNRGRPDAYHADDIRLLERLAAVLAEGFQRFVDMAERDRLERQLREAQKMAAVGRLIAGVSHNFNNMLMMISGSLELARSGVSGESLGHLDAARGASRRASEVIKELMLLSRRDDTVREVIEVGPLVGQAVTICRRTFGDDIGVRLRVPEGLPGVRGRAAGLQQIALNLCLNARDAVQSPGVAEPRIEVDLECVRVPPARVPDHVPGRPARCLRLRVRDNGVGMDAQTRARLFEPFYTTKEVGKGTGLGLSTAYAIVRDHGGWIEVDSEPGRGALFAVYLPVADAEPAVAEEPPASRGRGRGEEILLVEDEDDIRDVVATILRRSGYAVHESGDGAAALERVCRLGTDLDLVLLDLSMPGMPGDEVLRHLNQRVPALDVVLFTGQDVQLEDYPDAAAVVNKPVRRQELLDALRSVLDRR